MKDLLGGRHRNLNSSSRKKEIRYVKFDDSFSMFYEQKYEIEILEEIDGGSGLATNDRKLSQIILVFLASF